MCIYLCLNITKLMLHLFKKKKKNYISNAEKGTLWYGLHNLPQDLELFTLQMLHPTKHWVCTNFLFLLWEECYYNYHLTHLLVYLISVVQWAFVIFSVLIMVFCSLTKSENRAVSPYRFSFIRSGSLVKKSTAMNSSTAKRRVST